MSPKLATQMIKNSIGRILNNRYKLFGLVYFDTIAKTDKKINIKLDGSPTKENYDNYLL